MIAATDWNRSACAPQKRSLLLTGYVLPQEAKRAYDGERLSRANAHSLGSSAFIDEKSDGYCSLLLFIQKVMKNLRFRIVYFGDFQKGSKRNLH